ncbi:MAG: PilN domain-containing protein [Phycisphaeraceae bacterium]
MKAVNLIPEKRRVDRRRRIRLRAWVRLGTAYGLVMLAVVLVAQGVWGEADRALAEARAEMTAESQEVEQRLTTLEPKLRQAMRTLEASRAVTAQPDWSLLMATLEAARPNAVMLNRINLESEGGYRLELAGVGEDQQVVSQYVLGLEGAGLFSDVTLVETTRTLVHERAAVAFRLRCRLGGEGDGR